MCSFNSEHGNKKCSKTEQDQKKKKKNAARPKARRDMVGVLRYLGYCHDKEKLFILCVL